MPWWAWVLIALNSVQVIQHAWTHIDLNALIHAWADEDEEDTKDVVAQLHSLEINNCIYCGKPNEGHKYSSYTGIPIKVCEIY